MDISTATAKELREYLKENNIKFWPGMSAEKLRAKAQEHANQIVPPIPPETPTEPEKPQNEPVPPVEGESHATGNVGEITTTPATDTATVVEAPEAPTPTQEPPAPAVSLKDYNPETHMIVNKKAFETMLVNLVASRTQMYVRQNLLHKLSELLDVSHAEATKIYSDIMQRVMVG